MLALYFHTTRYTFLNKPPKGGVLLVKRVVTEHIINFTTILILFCDRQKYYIMFARIIKTPAGLCKLYYITQTIAAERQMRRR